jgi:ketosteroid isomerase-like protein
MSLKETVQSWCDRYATVLSGPGARGSGAFFTDDADLLPPGPDNVKGAAAIEAFWAAVSEHYHNVRLTTLDAAQLGPDHIREIGTYYAEPKAAGGANLSGKYVFIWRKVGSEWKIWTDIWASHSGQT